MLSSLVHAVTEAIQKDELLHPRSLVTRLQKERSVQDLWEGFKSQAAFSRGLRTQVQLQGKVKKLQDFNS